MCFLAQFYHLFCLRTRLLMGTLDGKLPKLYQLTAALQQTAGPLLSFCTTLHRILLVTVKHLTLKVSSWICSALAFEIQDIVLCSFVACVTYSSFVSSHIQVQLSHNPDQSSMCAN